MTLLRPSFGQHSLPLVEHLLDDGNEHTRWCGPMPLWSRVAFVQRLGADNRTIRALEDSWEAWKAEAT